MSKTIGWVAAATTAWLCSVGVGWAADANDGLALYFSCDREAVSGVITDQSGQGNHGTVQGATLVPEGRIGGACRFDGVDDSIVVPASGSLDVGQQGPLTLAVWYNVATTAQGPILEWAQSLQDTGVHLWVNTIGWQWNGRGTGANLVDTSGDENTRVISAHDRPINTWHHLAVTYDQASGLAQVFVDGRFARAQKLGAFTPQTGYPLHIGDRPFDHQIFAGLLDEIRVYRRALSREEIPS